MINYGGSYRLTKSWHNVDNSRRKASLKKEPIIAEIQILSACFKKFETIDSWELYKRFLFEIFFFILMPTRMLYYATLRLYSAICCSANATLLIKLLKVMKNPFQTSQQCKVRYSISTLLCAVHCLEWTFPDLQKDKYCRRYVLFQKCCTVSMSKHFQPIKRQIRVTYL